VSVASAASVLSRSCRTWPASLGHRTESIADRSLGGALPTATCPIPVHESSQLRRAWRARSYEGSEHPAKPTVARRNWPRWSIMLRGHFPFGSRGSTVSGRQLRPHGPSGAATSFSLRGRRATRPDKVSPAFARVQSFAAQRMTSAPQAIRSFASDIRFAVPIGVILVLYFSNGLETRSPHSERAECIG